jgi:hypothetical protein
VVEPLIASIAKSPENLFVVEVRARRIALVFLFGLLHGMGFAGALKSRLPRSEFVCARDVNLGVEGRQLAVIGIAFLLVAGAAAVTPSTAGSSCPRRDHGVRRRVLDPQRLPF